MSAKIINIYAGVHRRPFAATFEDKRKANFDKGQAVLDRRRQQLRDNELHELETRKAVEARENEMKLKIKFVIVYRRSTVQRFSDLV